MAAADDLIVQRPEGLYCPPGDFYIDPWRRVERAVITHAHADHARSGHAHYLAHTDSAGVLRARLGARLPLQTLPYGQAISHRGVKVSLHPAGHVLGSAQVRVEHAGRVWVASGDYKVAPDPTCAPFEPQRCDVFITESTFGLPIYRWAPDAEVLAGLHRWWADNADQGHASVLACYSFGKTQRILHGLDAGIGPIVCHSAADAINQAYRDAGVALPECTPVQALTPERAARALVLCPPNTLGSDWMRPFGDYRLAFASGWMRVRGGRRRAGFDRGFVLSDHADWPGLMSAIAATGAPRVIVTHGSVPVMVRHLRGLGLDAGAFDTEYGDTEALGRAEAAEGAA